MRAGLSSDDEGPAVFGVRRKPDLTPRPPLRCGEGEKGKVKSGQRFYFLVFILLPSLSASERETSYEKSRFLRQE